MTFISYTIASVITRNFLKKMGLVSHELSQRALNITINVTVLPGVTIGEGSIVAAGAVVTTGQYDCGRSAFPFSRK